MAISAIARLLLFPLVVAIGSVSVLALPSEMDALLFEVSDLTALAAIIGLVLAILLIFIAVFSVTLLLESALIHGVATQFNQAPISVKSALSVAWKRKWAAAGALAFSALAVGLLAINIIGIPVAVYFAIRWTFILHAAVLEGYPPLEAMARSSQLVKGNWWRVLGILLVLGLATIVISLIGLRVLGLIPVLGQVIATILITPIFSISRTLLYFDLRVRNQASDLV